MANFDRQYRLAAGAAGSPGFEVGAIKPDLGVALHISFSLEKTEAEEPNTGKIQLWNLSQAQLSVLEQKDCEVTLRAGYGSSMPLAFSGTVTYVVTSKDGADTLTEIEARDGRVALRDTYVTLSYAGVINGKKLLEDLAGKMGVAVTISEQAAFIDFPNGFSFVGAAKTAITRVCTSCGLVWTLQNGILQVRKPYEPISTRVYLLNSDTGLLDIPKRVSIAPSTGEGEEQLGWEVRYLMNAAIGVNDFVSLGSKVVSGNFRVNRLYIDGDNLEGEWTCTAQLLEVK